MFVHIISQISTIKDKILALITCNNTHFFEIYCK